MLSSMLVVESSAWLGSPPVCVPEPWEMNHGIPVDAVGLLALLFALSASSASGSVEFYAFILKYLHVNNLTKNAEMEKWSSGRDCPESDRGSSSKRFDALARCSALHSTADT